MQTSDDYLRIQCIFIVTFCVVHIALLHVTLVHYVSLATQVYAFQSRLYVFSMGQPTQFSRNTVPNDTQRMFLDFSLLFCIYIYAYITVLYGVW